MLALALVVPVVVVATLGGCGSSEATRTLTETVRVTVTAEVEASGETPVDEVEPSAGSEPRLVVAESGFSQKQENVSVGVVLENTTDAAALGVELLANLVAGNGDILATQTVTIPVIPARARYYAGFGASLSRPDAIEHLETTITVDESSDVDYSLPKLTKLKLKPLEGLGLTVTGELMNPLPESLSRIAQFTVVLYNRAGKVIGGGFGYPPAEVRPGARVAIQALNGMDGIDPGRAVSVHGSAANEGTETFEPIPPASG